MRAAVLGSPIAHSLSPVLHRAAYAHLGLDWTYEAVQVQADTLAVFLQGLGEDWAGLSLTMPLKTAVLPLLDEADEATTVAGAANTVVLRGGRRLGANTDVPGLVGALAHAGVAPRDGARRAALVGAGATARSAVASLAAAGYRTIDVVARRPAVAQPVMAVGQRLGVEVVVHPWQDAGTMLDAPLVVSTVPAAGADTLVAGVPSRPGTLFDVVYDPWPTVLATAWAAAGGPVLGGLDLLVQQAALQVRAMTGCAAGVQELVAAMRPAGAAALSQHTR